MGFWFNEKDSNKVILEYLVGNTPDSIKQEVRQELIKRGYSDEQINKYKWEHDG